MQPLGRLDPRHPQAHPIAARAGGVGGEEGDVAARGELNHVAGRGREVGLAVATDLDGPQAGRQAGREVDLDGPAVGGGGVDLGRQGPRGVDDDEVALGRGSGAARRSASAPRCRRTWWPPASVPRRGSCRGSPGGVGASSSAGSENESGCNSGRRRGASSRAGMVRALMSALPTLLMPLRLPPARRRRGSARSDDRSGSAR